ncbi:MAG: SpoIID/LytB domain-containing protein [Gemmatimonadota bacterium]
MPSGALDRTRFMEPRVRVAVQVAVETTTVSSPGGLRILDRDDGRVAALAGPHDVWRFRAQDGVLDAMPAGRADGADAFERPATSASEAGAPSPETSGRALRAVTVEVREGDAPIFLHGKPYRGSAELVALPHRGLNVINFVSLEDYLLGVVPSEIGPREPEEFAAVAAQAIAARTYAIANLGSHLEMGFDLFATVADQVYEGMLAEREDATRAVRETAGRILTYQGEPIRAYYHSTCGGRTAAVTEVLDRPDAPYLRPVLDRDDEGRDFCSISPRYRWTEEFDGSALNAVVREELARYFGVTEREIGPLERVEVRSRTRTGRVRELAIRGPGSEFVLSRNDIRFVLRNAEGQILNSTNFDVVDGEKGTGSSLHGRGYGHGVGMCQFGAVGRARAGQSWEKIVRAYYVGTEVTRLYGEGE